VPSTLLHGVVLLKRKTGTHTIKKKGTAKQKYVIQSGSHHRKATKKENEQRKKGTTEACSTAVRNNAGVKKKPLPSGRCQQKSADKTSPRPLKKEGTNFKNFHILTQKQRSNGGAFIQDEANEQTDFKKKKYSCASTKTTRWQNSYCSTPTHRVHRPPPPPPKPPHCHP